MTLARCIAASVAAMALTSCGGGDGASARVWDESEVLRLAGIESVDGGAVYRLKSAPDCQAAVVMTNKGTVDLYADAGDTVAKNPTGTAGVKVTSAEEATCAAAFTEALQAVE